MWFPSSFERSRFDALSRFFVYILSGLYKAECQQSIRVAKAEGFKYYKPLVCLQKPHMVIVAELLAKETVEPFVLGSDGWQSFVDVWKYEFIWSLIGCAFHRVAF